MGIQVSFAVTFENVGYSQRVRALCLSSFTILGSLVLASLALSHHLIYFLVHGSGESYSRAMTEAGHDRYWTTFLLVIGTVTVVLTAVAVRQLRRLAALAAAARVGNVNVRDVGVDGFLRTLVPLWIRLMLLTAVAFLLQENIESASVGQAMPGLGPINGEHGVALPIIGAVSLLIAAVRALVRWRRDVLLARLGAARLSFRQDPHLQPVVNVIRPTSSGNPHRNGVRAPTASAAAPA